MRCAEFTAAGMGKCKTGIGLEGIPDKHRDDIHTTKAITEISAVAAFPADRFDLRKHARFIYRYFRLARLKGCTLY